MAAGECSQIAYLKQRSERTKFENRPPNTQPRNLPCVCNDFAAQGDFTLELLRRISERTLFRQRRCLLGLRVQDIARVGLPRSTSRGTEPRSLHRWSFSASFTASAEWTAADCLSRQTLRRSSRVTSRNLGDPVNNRPIYAASRINQLRKSSSAASQSSVFPPFANTVVVDVLLLLRFSRERASAPPTSHEPCKRVSAFCVARMIGRGEHILYPSKRSREMIGLWRP